MASVHLFNVNLQTNECIAEVEVEFDSRPVQDVITDLRRAAEGLTDPTVSIDHDDDYYLVRYTLSVKGARQLTDAERTRIISERDRERRFREHMESFRG